LVYRKKKKMAKTRTATPADPNADRIPIKMPLPVDPVSLILITIDGGASLPDCGSCCCQPLWPGVMVDVDERSDSDDNVEVVTVTAAS
jgi:hypothetical protein